MRVPIVAIALLMASPGSAAERVVPVGGDPAGIVAVNPVTSEVLINHQGAFARRISVLDPSTDTVRDVTLPGDFEFYFNNWRNGPFQLDPLRNRLYVRLVDGTLVALDLETLVMQTLAVPVGLIAVDPGNDRLYATPPILPSGSAPPTLLSVDGESLQVETLDLLPYFDGFDIPDVALVQGLIVDPRAGRAQIVGNGYSEACYEHKILEVASSPPQVVNASPTMCNWGADLYAVDPFVRRTFYGNPFDIGYATWFTVYRWQPAPTLSPRVGSFDFPGRRRWFSFLNAFDEWQLACRDDASETWCFAPVWSAGVEALNPATRRVYAEMIGSPPELRAIDADTGAWQTVSPLGSDFWLGDVNVTTNKLYGIGRLAPGGTFGVVEIDEPIAAPVPMPTTITLGTPSPDGTVTVDFSASSAWVPHAHDVLRIVYQVDSTDGRWLRGSSDGSTTQATITGLAAGPHTIYAMATDGTEGRVTYDYTVVTGPIASAGFTVPEPLACQVEMSQAAYQNGQDVVITSLRFRNPNPTPQAVRLRLSLTLPFGVTVDALDVAIPMPASFDKQLGPVTMFTLQPGQPRGDFTWRCALEHQSTGAVFAEHTATFAFE